MCCYFGVCRFVRVLCRFGFDVNSRVFRVFCAFRVEVGFGL